MTTSIEPRRDVVDVRVEGAEWPGKLDGRPPADLVTRAVAATLASCGPKEPAEISVLLTDAETVRALNRDYRDRDAPTNVLAFALQDSPNSASGTGISLLGDIVIAGGVCRDEAAVQGKSMADHVRHLSIHGTLHLLGLDHESAKAAETMEGLERAILATLGVTDPYDAAAVA